MSVVPAIPSQISQWNPNYIYFPGQVVSYVGSSALIGKYTVNNGLTSLLGVPPQQNSGVLNTGWATAGSGSGGINQIQTSSPASTTQIILDSTTTPIKISEVIPSFDGGTMSVDPDNPTLTIVERQCYTSLSDFKNPYRFVFNCTIPLYPNGNITTSEDITLTLYMVSAWTPTAHFITGNLVGIPGKYSSSLGKSLYYAYGTPTDGVSPDLDSGNWASAPPTHTGSPYGATQCCFPLDGTIFHTLPIAPTLTIPVGNYSVNTIIPATFSYSGTNSFFTPFPHDFPVMFILYAKSTNPASIVGIYPNVNNYLCVFGTS